VNYSDCPFRVSGPFLASDNAMKQKPADTGSILADALRALAVAIAIFVLTHLVFWIAGQGVMATDGMGDPPESTHDSGPP
jgi:hypothetical protein